MKAPDFATEVVAPLHAQQTAEKAREDAARAAQEAADALAQQQVTDKAQAALTAPTQAGVFTGACADWLAAAGVTDISDAMVIINRESGCNPWAVNASLGSCGVAQELPCGKSGCSLGDGACQVQWMDGYVTERYGSWANALAHSDATGWY